MSTAKRSKAQILGDAEYISGVLLRQLKQLERVDGRNDWLQALVLVARVRQYVRVQRELERRRRKAEAVRREARA